MNVHAGLRSRWSPLMPEIDADPPSPFCSPLLFGPGVQESQLLCPDPFLPRARDARGRFAKGSSGNPGGRPRGIPNPKRRVPDLVARPLSAEALSDLLDRKPDLLRPLTAQLLPPPLAATDPAERLGIDLSSLRTVEDFPQVLLSVLAAVARGEIAPVEGARIARRVRVRLRALRRFARLAAADRTHAGASRTCRAVRRFSRHEMGGRVSFRGLQPPSPRESAGTT